MQWTMTWATFKKNNSAPWPSNEMAGIYQDK